MTTTQLAFHFVKSAAVILNGLFVPVSLYTGLLVMAASMPHEFAFLRMGRSLVTSVASLVIIATLVVSERRLPLIWAGYGAGILFLVVSKSVWNEHFNMTSDLSPPTEAVIYGSLAILKLTSLAMNRPLQLTSLLKHRSARIFFIGSVIVVGVTAIAIGITVNKRIASQYSYAMHFMRLGGAVRWESGSVVRISLRMVAIADNNLRYLTHFPNLMSLDLSKTNCSDAGLTHIAEVRSLESLHLYETGITDRGLQYLSGLTKLRDLWMNQTKVTDQGLVHLEGMTEMGYLDLGYTEVTDAGLPHLYGMKKMYYLHLVGTEVTEEGLRRIASVISGLSTYNGRVSVDR